MADDFDPDEEEAPAPPPTVFGLDASPAGCGMLAALGFALVLAPSFLLYYRASGCAADDPYCVPGAAPGAGVEALAAAALLAGLFGLAAGAMVRRRLIVLRAGGSDRPPLWAAFVALTWLAVPVAFILGPLLMALLAG